MTNKNKKRITSAFLVLCYCLGNFIAPVTANTDSGISSLLDKRENHESGENTSLTDFEAANSQSHNFSGAQSVSDFSDVSSSDWYYTYLDYLVSGGIINGKSKTEFAPDESFSFAECSAVIARYLGLDGYASQMSSILKANKLEGSDKWYSGYISVMYELGIFREEDGLFTVKDGLTEIIGTRLEEPMKRYEFACCIARSFELPANGVRSKNIYSEVSGLGHDFIIGGRYNRDVLNRYPDFIKDFDAIPDHAKEDVTKVYYNGIFNGDTEGNFNPDSFIKRSEMAKVLATVRDFSLRKCLISDYYTPVSKDKLFYDCFGNESLDSKYCTEVLTACARGFDASGNEVVYKPLAPLPYGYCVDVYLYSQKGDLCESVLQYTLAASDAADSGFKQSFADGTSYRAILVLRNLTESARPEFTLDVYISPDGILTKPLTV